MSSIQTNPVNPTELRLDYKELVARQLVIVIDGRPIADHDAQKPRPVDLSAASPSRSNHSRSHGSRSSPVIEDANAINDATGYAPALFTPMLLAAWRGQEGVVLELVTAMIEGATAEDAGRAFVLTEYVKAVLYNGLGRYEHAVAAAQHAFGHEEPGLSNWACVELAEARARSDRHAGASEALRALDQRTSAGGTDWALGVRARSAALLSDGDVAEALYREALERFARCEVSLHRARVQLVYGEWLRRENRRVHAREQLRAAYDTFSSVAAEAFAGRTRRELLATGENARRRADYSRDILTPQEAQIARLARDGFSNPEIGSQLFISPRTVQYHLRKVFLKLEITSRNQLGRISPSHLGMA